MLGKMVGAEEGRKQQLDGEVAGGGASGGEGAFRRVLRSNNKTS